MKPLTYNNPERAKERAENEAPQEFEIKSALKVVDDLLPDNFTSTREVLQRIIWDYENLKYFYTVVGGYEGLLKLQQNQGGFNCECEVNYEIVKT